MKLDLACGQSCEAGFEGVDLWEGAHHQFSLIKFPWPIADNSVDEARCSHFVEHLPTEFVNRYGESCRSDLPNAKDMFFAFFDEAYRVLKPNAKLTVIVPALRNDRAFQDPTHRRFITWQMFEYLSMPWRKRMGLSHYNVSCNFSAEIYAMAFERAKDPGSKIEHWKWNEIDDWKAVLKAVK